MKNPVSKFAVRFDLYRYGAGELRRGRGAAVCALTPPDPQLKGVWYPGGFKSLSLNINPGFKTCLSKWVNLCRYDTVRVCASDSIEDMVGLHKLNPV